MVQPIELTGAHCTVPLLSRLCPSRRLVISRQTFVLAAMVAGCAHPPPRRWEHAAAPRTPWLPSPRISHDGNGRRRQTNAWREVTSLHGGPMLPTSNRQRGAIRAPPIGQDPLRGSAAGLSPSRWKLNMNWQNPGLYLFLGLLAGFAALLAIIYECIQRFRMRKPPVAEPRRSTVTEKAVDLPSPPKAVAPPSPPKAIDLPSPPKHPSSSPKPVAPPSPPKHVAPLSAFDQLCESIKDLPPAEQARRMDQHFGAFGGARPRRAEVDMASGHFSKSR